MTYKEQKPEGYNLGALAGRAFERERIIKLLEPLAQHDEEMCYHEEKLECWPEDCNADTYISAIRLIKGEYDMALIKGKKSE